MNALVVGVLDVNDQSNLSDQSLALANLTLSFRGIDDPANQILDQVASFPADQIAIVNRYYMPPPEAVVYCQSEEDQKSVLTAEALADAFENLNGNILAVNKFNGELRNGYSDDLRSLGYESLVIIDPSFKSNNSEPLFKLADISRQHQMSLRPGGGDPNSGIAAIGKVSRSLVNLMKVIMNRKVAT